MKVAKPSATLLLMKDVEGSQENRIELLLVKRSKVSRFLPGALVFPGGGTEKGDQDYVENRLGHEHCLNCTSNWLQWGMTEQSFAIESLGTAVRECEEETGLFLSLENLMPDTISCIAHWLTPARLPKRFDTYFWGAILNDKTPQFSVDHNEIESVQWWTPSKALAAYYEGLLDLPVPTFMILSELHYLLEKMGTELTAESLLHEVASVPHYQPIQPILSKTTSVKLQLPGDPQYPSLAVDGEQEAHIKRPFWQNLERHYLEQKKEIQLQTDAKTVKRWYRVTK